MRSAPAPVACISPNGFKPPGEKRTAGGEQAKAPGNMSLCRRKRERA